MVKKGPENIQLKTLVRLAEKTGTTNKAAIWKKTAFLLAKPTREKPEVNLYSIEKHSKEGDTVLVPGKVLSQGSISHKVTVAAFRFSKPAASKLAAAGCKILSIKQLMQANPSGKGVVLLAK